MGRSSRRRAGLEAGDHKGIGADQGRRSGAVLGPYRRWGQAEGGGLVGGRHTPAERADEPASHTEAAGCPLARANPS